MCSYHFSIGKSCNASSDLFKCSFGDPYPFGMRLPVCWKAGVWSLVEKPSCRVGRIFCTDWQNKLKTLNYKHTERQWQHQASAAASPMHVYGDASKSVPDPLPNSDARLDAAAVAVAVAVAVA